MAKLLLILIILLISRLTNAQDKLVGKSFSNCEEIHSQIQREYVVEFMSGNEEFEAEIIRNKTGKNCKGDPIFAIGRVWNYELNDNELITTLDRVNVVVLDPLMQKIFNEKKACGVSKWEIDKITKCEGQYLYELEHMPGYRTIHQIKLIGNKLKVIDSNGESFELHQEAHQ